VRLPSLELESVSGHVGGQLPLVATAGSLQLVNPMFSALHQVHGQGSCLRCSDGTQLISLHDAHRRKQNEDPHGTIPVRAFRLRHLADQQTYLALYLHRTLLHSRDARIRIDAELGSQPYEVWLLRS
jgi:hypothetical protein